MTAPAKLTKATLMKIPDVEERINERLDELLVAMMDLALGHKVQVNKFNKETGEMETRIYSQPPDYKALSFLIENVIGKVPQRVEMTGAGGGAIQVIPYMTMAEAVKAGLRPQLTAPEEDDPDIIEGELVSGT